MCVFPKAEHRQRPVDPDRDERREKPCPRQRLDIIDPSPQGICQQARKESEINPETTRAHRKLMLHQMHRPVGHLMADVAEEGIERICDRPCPQTCRWSQYDCPHPDENDRNVNAPSTKGLGAKMPGDIVRYVAVGRFGHTLAEERAARPLLKPSVPPEVSNRFLLICRRRAFRSPAGVAVKRFLGLEYMMRSLDDRIRIK